MYRLDADITATLNQAVAEIESGRYQSLGLNVPPENARWLSKLAFTSENSVAPIDGWFDPYEDEIVYAGEVANMAMDGNKVDYGDYCEVFEKAPIEDSILKIERYRGEIYVAARGATPARNLNGIMEKWSALQDHLAGAPEPAAVDRQRD